LGRCGDGTLQSGDEQCEPGQLGGADCQDFGFYGGELSCTAGCLFDTTGCSGRCGDGTFQSGFEQCEGTELGGKTCEDFGFYGGSLSCSSFCTHDISGCAGRCGDGELQPSVEQCDGMPVVGKICPDFGFYRGFVSCTSGCAYDPSTCEGRCGDGVKDPEEGCDEGDANNSWDPDANCRPSCQPRRCGDGVRDDKSGEICDDGNNVAGDECSPDCLSKEVCGNGYVDLINGEECDDGNLVGGDGCSTGCLVEYCGNHRLDPGEVCDDGNHLNGDGCSPDCQSDETCSNGYVDWVLGEECDDGNKVDGDGCNQLCGVERCGNSYVEPDEVCDDGNNLPSDGCSPDCQSDETCGNGYVDWALGEECDDGNALGHDECSNDCIKESLVWTDRFTGNKPERRTETAMAFDVGRGVLVLFGGLGKTGPLSDTWEWKGGAWRRIYPQQSPWPRAYHQMVYDARRGRVVLFGGGPDTTFTYDDSIWEWDGKNWTRITPTLTPAARIRHRMAYDSGRGVVVVHGGYYNDSGTLIALTDTWEWNGVLGQWTMGSAGPAPVVSPESPMAYDPVTGVTILLDVPSNPLEDGATYQWNGSQWIGPVDYLAHAARPFGALCYDVSLSRIIMQGNGTWAFNGTSWVDAGIPGPDLSAAWYTMAHDPATMRLYLLAYWSQPTPVMSIFERENSSWSGLNTPSLPPSRAFHGMAFDSARGKTIIFGGLVDIDRVEDPLGDIWEWNGHSWKELWPEHASPEPRGMIQLAYDWERERVVLFGGYGLGGIIYDDTWEWDGQEWERLLPHDSPPARFGYSMGYDPKQGRTVLFGGFGQLGNLLYDTWEWDGVDWLRGSGSTDPHERFFASMAFAPDSGMLLLKGGTQDDFTALDDFYTLQGDTWTLLGSDLASARYGHAMFTDWFQSKLLSFGGRISANYTDSTFVWQDGKFELVYPASTPRPRAGQGMAFDALRAEAVLFGGFGDNDVATQDTWSLSMSAASSSYEVCERAMDLDGDGLAGCLDPDCWGFCDPFCPPGQAMLCGANPANCGDGFCSLVESCRLCPADCGPCVICGDHLCEVSFESQVSCPGDCTPW
jgi:cysteine-rich repeat protein